MSLNSRIAAIGLAVQSAKGTHASAPTHWFGVVDGDLIELGVSQKSDDVSTGLRAGSAFIRDSVDLACGFTARVWPKMIGLILYGLLGSKSVSGSSTYTHIMTLGDTVPYFTVWAKMADGGYRCLADAKFDSGNISWGDAGPLSIACAMVGLSVTFPSTPTPVVDETRDAYFVAAGGTRQIDLDGNTLATIATKGGSVALNQNLAPALQDLHVTPYDVDEGVFEGAINLTGLPDDLTWARNILTGSPSGSVISEVPVIGSASVGFVSGSNTLTIAAGSVAFTVKEKGYDPKGGRPEFELSGDMGIPSGATTPVTATTVNTQSSY